MFKRLFFVFPLTVWGVAGFGQPANDNFGSAIDVSGLLGATLTCSADAAYTTIAGTADMNAGACWNNSGPQHNVWFSFVATTAEVYVQVDIGGSKGTQQRTQLALWDNTGLVELACDRYQFNGEDVDLGYTGLTPTNTYYISVDAFNASYDGTFTLCMQDNVDYDFYEGAIDVTSIINTCSADAAYSTIGGSPDVNAGSCWNNGGPLFNRWFKFTASTTQINVTVDIGGSKGTQQRTQLALWDTNGTTELACSRYQFNAEDVDLGYTGLTVSNVYYISVDAFNTSYDGTFSLCLDDAVDYDFYEGAIDVTSIINTCSADAAYTTIGGSPDVNAGSCWNNGGPLFNRWFKFTASTTQINITVDIGGSKGTQQRTQLALWDTNGTTELACASYQFNTEDVDIGYTGLTVSNVYYISVDAFNTSYDGTFTLCLDDAVDYDYYEGAINITDTNNWCSSDAQFTTIGGSPDRNAGSCWNNGGPLFNRWFKFTASTAQINITVDIGGSKGTQQRTQVALWESNGTTEVACSRYQFNSEDVVVGFVGLTPTNVYYISVDAFNASYDGTFTLCVDDQVDYDFYEGAIEITDLDNWCSSDAQFTTIGGSPDVNAGSCWNNGGPLFNRWFYFNAISSNVTITVDIGGSKGSQQRTQLALWEANGTTQVACNLYVSNGDDVSISQGGLTIGNDYYISVDAFNTSYDGTFTLCVDNVDETYYSTADGPWTTNSTWSIVGYGGAAASDYPKIGDIANIRDHDITLTTNETVGGILIDNSADNVSLALTGATLTVQGTTTMLNAGNNFTSAISLTNSTLDINDDLLLQRDGGNAAFSITLDNSTLNVNKTWTWDVNGGTTANNTLTLNNASSVVVGDDFYMDYSAGTKILNQINNTSTMTVARDIQFIATGDDLTEIELNNSAQLNIGRNFVRGSPAYGILDCNGASVVSYNSGTYLQTLGEDAGSGTGDAFSYQNVIINNARITEPQVTMEGPVSPSGDVTLTDGVLLTTSTNLLTMIAGSTLNGGNAGSYVDGPLKKIGNTDFIFQIGNGTYWAPAGIANLTGDAATEFTAEYFWSTPTNPSSLKSPDPNGDLFNISGIEYWDLANTGTASDADLTLHWKDQSRSGIDDYADLQIAHYDGAEWENLGQTSTTMSNPGSITVTGVTVFSPFTFGSLSSGSNPLPVEFVYFTAQAGLTNIVLEWQTAVEYQNDRFEVEKSYDGENFQLVAIVPGSGSSSELKRYAYLDRNPLPGLQYYRLKQVDFDGTYAYSPVAVAKFDGSAEQLMVYPVPLTSELLHARYSGEEIDAVYVYDISGSLVRMPRARKLVSGDWEIQLPIPKGVYILLFETSSGPIKRRVIKM